MPGKNDKQKKRTEFRLVGQTNTVRRACDGCRACCILPEIVVVDSPAYVACSHLTDKGCGIYTQRPAICRNFYCEWARGFAPEWMKPDQCGILPGHTADHAAMQLWEVWPHAAAEARVLQFIRQSNARGIHVVVILYPETDAATESPNFSTLRSKVYLVSGEVREFDGATYSETLLTLTK